MAKPPPPARIDEATSWLRQRVPMRKDVWLTLNDRARQHGFFAAGIVSAAVIRDMQQAVEAATAKGITFRDFKRQVGPALLKEWSGSVANPTARMVNIFRTNTQKAYNSGRMRQLLEPAVVRIMPYWTIVPVLDARTTPICQAVAKANVVLPATHAWWHTHLPPLHYQCRSTIRALMLRDARKLGISSEPPKNAEPMEGFGGVDQIPVDLKGIPKGIADEIRKRMNLTRDGRPKKGRGGSAREPPRPPEPLAGDPVKPPPGPPEPGVAPPPAKGSATYRVATPDEKRAFRPLGDPDDKAAPPTAADVEAAAERLGNKGGVIAQKSVADAVKRDYPEVFALLEETKTKLVLYGRASHEKRQCLEMLDAMPRPLLKQTLSDDVERITIAATKANLEAGARVKFGSDSLGDYDPAQNGRIRIWERPGDWLGSSAQVLAHELGHAHDFMGQGSSLRSRDSAEFVKLWRGWRGSGISRASDQYRGGEAFWEYYTVDSHRGREEAFAEAFGRYVAEGYGATESYFNKGIADFMSKWVESYRPKGEGEKGKRK